MSFDSVEGPLHQLYNDARHQPEFATKKLWTYIFMKFPFSGPQWIIGTEQPPTAYQNLNRADVIVEHYSNIALNVFLIAEKKRGKAEPNKIKEVEKQVFDRCKEFLHASDRQAVWAMTCYGPNFRLWLCRSSRNHLKSIYPKVDHGSREAYLDIKDNWEEFLQWCDFMKANPEPHESIMDDYRGKGKQPADYTTTPFMESAGESSGTYGQLGEEYPYDVSYSRSLAPLANPEQAGESSGIYGQAAEGYPYETNFSQLLATPADSYHQAGGPADGQDTAYPSTSVDSGATASYVPVKKTRKGWEVTLKDKTIITDPAEWHENNGYYAWQHRGSWYYAKFKR